MSSRLAFLAPLLAALFLCAAPARAVVMVDVTIQGQDVVFAYSGTLDVDGLSGPIFDTGSGPQITPAIGSFGNLTGGAYDLYSGLLSAPSFGAGGNFLGSGGTGDAFFVHGPLRTLHLPSAMRRGRRSPALSGSPAGWPSRSV
jgi:hypothetical protein